MLFRKRPRAPMRRTTSMTEFAAEVEAPRPSDQVGTDRHGHHFQGHLLQLQRSQRQAAEILVPVSQIMGSGGADWMDAGYYLAAVVPRGGGVDRRRNSGDFAVVETAPFLRACGLCKRRLGPGRDTFMYRGDIAFCSLECRQLHINQEEWKEKCLLTSMKDTSPSSDASDKSDTGETVAAA
ncbi:hypothetical protein Cni_G04976 [Canna indica]|uniref:FLZ-type domain-containing protein n=1 Tax=Canna indica TaxID=4628 RepID=A0AAQ3JW86_9LILI|nr:hypothetical protein Cni_G04976 [Canna indica]